jgi:hypothetical protein
MHSQTQETNSKYYQIKREVRSKVTRLLRNSHTQHRDYLVSKLDSFNKKILCSIETNLLKVKKDDRMYFGKRNKFDELKCLYSDISSFKRNEIPPAEILKTNLNTNEMKMLRNDVNYFIKDSEIVKSLNFKPTKNLVQKLAEEEEKSKFDEIRREVGKKRKADVMTKRMLEILRGVRLKSEDFFLNNEKDSEKHYIGNQNKVVHPFDSKLEQTEMKLKNVIKNQEKMYMAVKKEKEDEKKMLEKKMKKMAADLNRIGASNIKLGTISGQEYSKSGLTESKSTMIDNIKMRNMRNHKLSKFREKNDLDYQEEIDLKKRIDNIKENFLLTNLNNVGIKVGINNHGSNENKIQSYQRTPNLNSIK